MNPKLKWAVTFHSVEWIELKANCVNKVNTLEFRDPLLGKCQILQFKSCKAFWGFGLWKGYEGKNESRP